MAISNDKPLDKNSDPLELDATKLSRTQKKAGRAKPIQTDEELQETVLEFAKCGYSMHETARALGVSSGTFWTWMRDESFIERYDGATDFAKMQVGKALFDLALSGNVPAIIWFEKTRGKKREYIGDEADSAEKAVEKTPERRTSLSEEELRDHYIKLTRALNSI